MTAYAPTASNIVPSIASNLVCVACTNGAQALSSADTFVITLPEAMGGNYLPVACMAYSASSGTYTWLTTAVITNHVVSTRKTTITVGSAGIAANSRILFLYAPVS